MNSSSSRIIGAISEKIALLDRLQVVNATNLTDVSPNISTVRLIQGKQFSLGEVGIIIAAAAAVISVCVYMICLYRNRQPASYRERNTLELAEREQRIMSSTQLSNYFRKKKYSEINEKIDSGMSCEEFLNDTSGEQHHTAQIQRNSAV